MDWTLYDAALFDLDGVLTPTAEVHMRAWSEMFNDYLTSQGVAEPYTDEDYFAHVDGRPRYEGVRTFLESRGIELPEGDPSDGVDAETVCGLGNRKNEAFNEVLRLEAPIQDFSADLADDPHRLLHSIPLLDESPPAREPRGVDGLCLSGSRAFSRLANLPASSR